MDLSRFYLYDGRHPVVVNKLLCGTLAEVRFIEDQTTDDGDVLPEKVEVVEIAKLEVLTRDLAEESIRRVNRVVGMCNMRIHAFNECLRYLEE
jgi:hypothetical protein